MTYIRITHPDVDVNKIAAWNAANQRARDAYAATQELPDDPTARRREQSRRWASNHRRKDAA